MPSPLTPSWDHTEKSRTNTAKHTTRDEMLDLKDRFEQRFGVEGKRHVEDLVVSGRLNGNKGADDDPEGYYPGMAYSIATGTYFLRRALGESNAEDAYDIFIKDIDHTNEITPGDDVQGRYPEREWLEKLTAPYFEDLLGDRNPSNVLVM